MRTTYDISEAAAAMSVVYAESVGRHASAQARSELRPDDDRLYLLASEAKVASDNCHRRLLDLINELRDVGAGIVAEAMLCTAGDNAGLASTLAFRGELDLLREAA